MAGFGGLTLLWGVANFVALETGLDGTQTSKRGSLGEGESDERWVRISMMSL